MRQHIRAPDPWAAITGALLTLSGIFEVEKALGITGSQMAIAIGSLITIGASVRHILKLRSERPAPVLPSETPTLTEESEG